MNERIKEAINKNIVEPLLNERAHNLSGTVVKTYYSEEAAEAENSNQNAADVEVLLPSTGFKQVLFKVPIMINGTMGGVDGAKIKTGDTVSISFQGGSGKYPRIIGKIERDPGRRNKELKSDAGNNVPEFSSLI